MSELRLKDVKRLRLEPGDVLILRLEDPLPHRFVEDLCQQMAEAFPDNKTVVLGEGMDLEVLSDRSGGKPHPPD